MESRVHGTHGAPGDSDAHRYTPTSDASPIVEAIARSRMARARVSLRDLVTLAAIGGAVLVALGWRWDSPAKTINALELRVTHNERRMDTLVAGQRFTNYMLCTDRAHPAGSPSLDSLVARACQKAVADMERP